MKAIALLGRRDEPTDGVADYCKFLAPALLKHNFELEVVRVPWAERGWSEAMRWLSTESQKWTGEWVLLQYNALAWSRRGFPVRARCVLKLLQRRGARCAVVFHDAQAFEGSRFRDRLRGRIQNWTMLELYKHAERSAFTVPLSSAEWLPSERARAAFIPIGANIPSLCIKRSYRTNETPKVVTVFSVTGGDACARETEDIAHAVRSVNAKLGPVRLEVFGRGAENAQKLLEEALSVPGIELRVRGVISAEEITRTLTAAHVLLFVRGVINSHRGTAIAGISCGLPVVAYGKAGDDPAIDSAGCRLAPWHNQNALAAELRHVLSDTRLWQGLHERSLRAQAEYFSWDAVAGRYARLLSTPETRQ
jgi:glycosyltransferase involved in cell wall biosynthesis